MTRLLPLLLLLAACAVPSEYRFPPANPAPVYAPPGTGLPMPSHGLGVRNVPRSPNRRVLPPPGKEPGLWSADRPKASAAAPEPAVIFGETIPLDDPEIKASQPVQGCVAALGGAFVNDHERVNAVVRWLNQEQRRCAALRAFAWCLGAAASGPVSKEDAEHATRLQKRLDEQVRDQCAKHHDTTEEVLSAVLVSIGREDAFQTNKGGPNVH